MAAAPDAIDLERDRDLRGRHWHIWVRRGLVTLLTLFIVAGLLNLFGQRPSGTTASAGGATVHVYSPTRVRGGLMWESRFTITAERELKDARLVLSQGWLEGMTINTIEPSPVGEASRNGSLELDLGHVPAGQHYVLYMQFQVNPTNVGRRSIDSQLLDGDRVLLSIHRTITIFP